MKTFNGPVLFLDRSDINTDEIIPARYLTEGSKAALAPYLLEDLELPGFDRRRDLARSGAIVSRANFGCGSSREHAPWALEVNGIHLVIAESFARIFRRNMFNCGMAAVALEATVIDDLFAAFAGQATTVRTDLTARRFVFQADGVEERVDFTLSAFDLALIEAGGWVDYADLRY